MCGVDIVVSWGYLAFMAKSKARINKETGLKQVSVWLLDEDVQTLRAIGKRPEIDREWSWLARKAIREYIERDEAAKRTKK